VLKIKIKIKKQPHVTSGYCIGHHKFENISITENSILLESNALEFKKIPSPWHPSPTFSRLPLSPENFILFRVAQRPPSGEEMRCRDTRCLVIPNSEKGFHLQFFWSILLGHNQIWKPLFPVLACVLVLCSPALVAEV
jgi:hypothetical protein